MGQVYVEFVLEKELIELDIEYSGSSVCGMGPDDETPTLEKVTGHARTRTLEGVTMERELTTEEIEKFTNNDPWMGYIYEAIHEAQSEPSDPEYDY